MLNQVLIDVDGTLLDFVGHVLATVPGGTDLTTEKVERDLFAQLGEAGAEMKRTLLQDSDWWDGIPPLPGAVEGVAELRARFERVVFLTAPWWSCWGWESARRERLRRLFGAKPRELCPWSQKEWVMGDMLIDDRPDTVWRWSQTNPCSYRHAFVYHWPWNEKERVLRGLHPFTWDSFLATPGAFLSFRWSQML